MSEASIELKLYGLLFETATEGLLVAKSDGSIQLCNKRMAEMFGYSVKEMEGLNVDDLIPGHLRQKHKSHREGYVKSPHPRPMGKGYDLVGVRKDGTSVPVEISLNFYKDNNELMVMALVMDVTQRKQQEAEIKLLNRNLEKRVQQRTRELRDSQQLYRTISKNFPNGAIKVLNDQFEMLFAEGKLQETRDSNQLIGQSYLNFIIHEKQHEVKTNLERVLQGENRSFELKSNDQYFLINTVGLENEENKIDRILLVEQNITPLKLAEEKMIASLEQERMLNELKSRFVSMASHEFRTPLSTVLSSLTLLEKYDAAGITDKKEKHYKRIRASVRHLTSILNDFLSLEKVESGKISVNLSRLNVQELCEELTEQHQEMAKPDQRIYLEFEGNNMFESDQNMLRIIFTNLLSNACKYSPQGAGIWVRVDIQNSALKLTVKDEGMGIPIEDQKSLFGRFFRAKNALNLEGTGLGLSIVKRYVEMLHGEISFESIPEEGTTFTVILPSM